MINCFVCKIIFVRGKYVFVLDKDVLDKCVFFIAEKKYWFLKYVFILYQTTKKIATLRNKKLINIKLELIRSFGSNLPFV